MDDIIDRLRKLKSKKSKKASPLEDFFEPEEVETTQPETDIGEGDLDIKPLGKSGPHEEIAEEPQEGAPDAPRLSSTDQNLAKGIRELSFDDLEEPPDGAMATPMAQKADELPKQVIEISIQDPNRIKQLKLIVALLEAEQFEAAKQEIDNMITF